MPQSDDTAKTQHGKQSIIRDGRFVGWVERTGAMWSRQSASEPMTRGDIWRAYRHGIDGDSKSFSSKADAENWLTA